MILAGGASQLTSPLAVAKKLQNHSITALKIFETLDAGSNRELKIVLNDIKTMALLGQYYAYKIAGATNLALYRETKDEK